MKQYTTPEQTAKLIELGFMEPIGSWETSDNVYSIGELIEMLPDTINVDRNVYSRVIDETSVCYYSWELETYAVSLCYIQEELIDNLYDMILKLKEEEII